MSLRRPLLGSGLALVAALFALQARSAEVVPFPHIPSVWDLELGRHARELSTDYYVAFACGTNGAPASLPLKDWTEFAKCPARGEPRLHEVQFRYDDEAEYRARALNQRTVVSAIGGTKVSQVAAVLSGLFDDDGFLAGLRIITDPRGASPDERLEGIALRTALLGRIPETAWQCESEPLTDEENPIGNVAIKERCIGTYNGTSFRLQTDFYRKVGEYAVDPRTGMISRGLFRGDVHFEMHLTDPIANKVERIAALKALPSPAATQDGLRQKVLNCPGCDLRGLNLKRFDLRRAKLAGANLAGADLHAAQLDNADLTGADLTGVIANRASFRLANLTGAKLSEAQLFLAALDGANFTGADLTGAHIAEATLTSTVLNGAQLVATDFSRARMGGARLRGAQIEGTWFIGAQLGRVDLSAAKLVSVDLTNAVLTAANLERATITQCDLFAANLAQANLDGANISASRLTGARMTDTSQNGTIFANVVDAPH
ncbi:MAG: pentapeptide repeat-containing protein [Bauldia sp.]